MGKIIVEAIKQALKFFQSTGGARELAQGAATVLKVAEQVIKRAG